MISLCASLHLVVSSTACNVNLVLICFCAGGLGVHDTFCSISTGFKPSKSNATHVAGLTNIRHVYDCFSQSLFKACKPGFVHDSHSCQVMIRFGLCSIKIHGKSAGILATPQVCGGRHFLFQRATQPAVAKRKREIEREFNLSIQPALAYEGIGHRNEGKVHADVISPQK